MTTIIVNFLAFATLLSSVFSITSKNPVISVIFLISTFVSGAGYLILIGIKFVGISYIIVYVGAIAVLFLFVIMLLNIRLSEITEVGTQYFKILPLAFVISALFLYLFLSVLPQVSNNVTIIAYLISLLTNFNSLLSDSNISAYNIEEITNNSLGIDTLMVSFTQIESLGLTLYTHQATLLIVLSMILLLAMLGTIVISKDNNNKNSY